MIFRLLTEKSDELMSLSLTEISPPILSMLSAQDKLEFPRLRELELQNLDAWKSYEADNMETKLLLKILDGAPKLEKIIHNGASRILKILPEHMYNLLSTFSFEERTKLPEM